MQRRNNYDHVIDLIPGECKVIYKAAPGVIKCTQLKKEEFIKLKFELIKNIKKSKDPGDRYYPFEVNNEYGCYSFNKEQQLIEMRKTRAEKLKDKQELNYEFRSR